MKQMNLIIMLTLILSTISICTVILFKDELHEHYVGFKHWRFTGIVDYNYYDGQLGDSFDRPQNITISNGWYEFWNPRIIDNKLVLPLDRYKQSMVSKKVGNLENFNLSTRFYIVKPECNFVIRFNAENTMAITGTTLLFGTPNGWAGIEIIGYSYWYLHDSHNIEPNRYYNVKVQYDRPIIKMKYWDEYSSEPEWMFIEEIGHTNGEYLQIRNDGRKWTHKCMMYVDYVYVH